MNRPSHLDPTIQKYLEDAGWQRLITAAYWRHDELIGQIFSTEQAIKAQQERETKKK